MRMFSTYFIIKLQYLLLWVAYLRYAGDGGEHLFLPSNIPGNRSHVYYILGISLVYPWYNFSISLV